MGFGTLIKSEFLQYNSSTILIVYFEILPTDTQVFKYKKLVRIKLPVNHLRNKLCSTWWHNFEVTILKVILPITIDTNPAEVRLCVILKQTASMQMEKLKGSF